MYILRHHHISTSTITPSPPTHHSPVAASKLLAPPLALLCIPQLNHPTICRRHGAEQIIQRAQHRPGDMLARHACNLYAGAGARHVDEHAVKGVEGEDALKRLAGLLAVVQVRARVGCGDDGQRAAQRGLYFFVEVVGVVVGEEDEVDAGEVV